MWAPLAAEATGGGVFLEQIDGIQDNPVIGTTSGANPLTGIRAHNGDIEVVTKGFGSPQDYGQLEMLRSGARRRDRQYSAVHRGSAQRPHYTQYHQYG